MEFYEKIVKVQTELKAPKGQYNSFGKYKYRSCEDIVESVKPLLNQVGLFLTLNDEIVLIGERYYIKAIVNLVDIETGKTIAETIGYAREEESKKGMDGSQITGASSSYSRKYALNAMFMIDDVKDSDTTNTHQKEQTNELKCPKCGGKITQQALDKWGMCSKCKQAEVKGE